MRFVELNLHKNKVLNWMNAFIQRYHSSPQEVLPSKDTYLSSKKHFFKAMLDNKFIGITGYTELSPTHIEIEKTIVHPKYRGKSYGKLISAEVVAYVRERGYKKVKSIIYTHNFPMLFIRLKQGFLIEGLIRNGDAPGLHEYHLGKEL